MTNTNLKKAQEQASNYRTTHWATVSALISIAESLNEINKKLPKNFLIGKKVKCKCDEKIYNVVSEPYSNWSYVTVSDEQGYLNYFQTSQLQIISDNNTHPDNLPLTSEYQILNNGAKFKVRFKQNGEWIDHATKTTHKEAIEVMKKLRTKYNLETKNIEIIKTQE